MKFYGKGSVWDRENSKKLVTFVDGSLETTEERIINILTGLGYESDPVIEEIKPIEIVKPKLVKKSRGKK